MNTKQRSFLGVSLRILAGVIYFLPIPGQGQDPVQGAGQIVSLKVPSDSLLVDPIHGEVKQPTHQPVGERLILTEELGETIDANENQRYHLFPQYPGYQYAYFQRFPDGRFVSIVVAQKEGQDHIVEQIYRSPKDIDTIMKYLKSSHKAGVAPVSSAQLGGALLFGSIGFSAGILVSSLMTEGWDQDDDEIEGPKSYPVSVIFLPLLPTLGANLGIRVAAQITDNETYPAATAKGTALGAVVGMLLTSLAQPYFEESYSSGFPDTALGAFAWDQAYPWIITGPSIVIGGIWGYRRGQQEIAKEKQQVSSDSTSISEG